MFRVVARKESTLLKGKAAGSLGDNGRDSSKRKSSSIEFLEDCFNSG